MGKVWEVSVMISWTFDGARSHENGGPSILQHVTTQLSQPRLDPNLFSFYFLFFSLLSCFFIFYDLINVAQILSFHGFIFVTNFQLAIYY
jgi:hypothetical protein